MFSGEPLQHDEFDINDIFIDITLTEESLARIGYKEGFQYGCDDGTDEGYRIGFEKGLSIGKELTKIYRTIVAEQQNEHSERVEISLTRLRDSIDKFPRVNDPTKDIISELINIRLSYKKICAMLCIPADKLECEDLSY